MNDKEKEFEAALALLGIKPSPKRKLSPFDPCYGEMERKASPIRTKKSEEVSFYNVDSIEEAIRRLVKAHNKMVDAGAVNVRLHCSRDEDDGMLLYCEGEISETTERMLERLSGKLIAENRRIAEIQNNYEKLHHFEKQKKEIEAEVEKAKTKIEEERAAREEVKARTDLEKARKELEAAQKKIKDMEARQTIPTIPAPRKVDIPPDRLDMDADMESGKIS